VVRDVYEELGQGDLPGILENFAPDARWILHGPAGIPFAGTHVGLAGIQAFFESFGKNAKVEKFETRNFIVEKNQVVVLGYEEVIAQPTGKPWKAHWAHVFTVQGGRIVLVEEIVDTAPILAAFQP
jgi:ketosteroid isomerase-like protein